jgi:hypothetical protein
MRRLTNGGEGFLTYEDIVVKAFEMFPDEFALRGYPQYPDSSDIHKPLYGTLKSRGLVRSAQKRFALTRRGVEIADRLINTAGTSLQEARNPERLGRPEEDELDRMLKSEAFRLFMSEQAEKILDTDFYAFLGCTVRTKSGDFQGRLKRSTEAIAAAVRLSKPDRGVSRRLSSLIAFLKKRFSKEIEWKAGNHAAN